MKKAISIVLSIIFVLAITLPASAITKVQVKDVNLKALAGADKPVSFNMFIRDPGQAPSKKNPVIKKIQDLTGVTIKFQFLVGDLDQKVGVMLASGDYPDIMFGASSSKFVDAGALLPLEDLIPKYPNLKEHYAPHMTKMIAAFDGKHAYTLENYGLVKNPAPVFEDTGVGFYMQKAVIMEEGNKIPRTVDEYFNMIESYKAKHPTIDGAKTIGFEILCDGWRDFCLRNPAQHLMGAGNDGDLFVDQKTMKSSLYQITDTAKAWYKKLNEEYQKGIIQAETFTENYDQYLSRLSSGAVLAMFDQAWNFGNATNALKKAGKYTRTYVAVPIANPGVKDAYLDAPSGTISGTGGITISKKCKNVDRLLAYYDWLLNRDVQDYLQWGVEGKDWAKAGTNGKVLTYARRELMKDTAKKRDQTGDTLWQYTPKMQGLYDDGAPCGPGDSADEYLASMTPLDKKFLVDNHVKYPAGLLSEPVKRAKYYPVWSIPVVDGSASVVASTKMVDICRKYYPQLIMEKPANYDALWAKFLAEIKAGNPQPYLDYTDAQIKRLNEAK